MFEKYSKIENSYKEKDVEQARRIVPASEPWVVQEKIDGANFSIWCDKDLNIRFAKRSGWLGSDEKFFAYQTVVEPMMESLREFFKVEMCFGPKNVAIFGELYGSGIQGRCDYGDQKKFIAFDVYDSSLGYKPQKGLAYSLNRFGIDFVPQLFVGTLDECLEYENTFASKLNEKQGNIAEGVVIKPVNRDYQLNSGKRVVFKNKTDSFSENSKPKKAKNPSKKYFEEENLQQAVDEICDLINENRVMSVISKEGNPSSPKQFGKFLGLTIQDAIEEYEEFYSASVKDFFGDNWKHANKMINTHAVSVVRPVFVKSIEE
tara:strand:+ start:294 stop:1247 length:954 start_codon:yes stop_codon:yes gene_type:complete